MSLFRPIAPDSFCPPDPQHIPRIATIAKFLHVEELHLVIDFDEDDLESNAAKPNFEASLRWAAFVKVIQAFATHMPALRRITLALPSLQDVAVFPEFVRLDEVVVVAPTEQADSHFELAVTQLTQEDLLVKRVSALTIS
ncbi:MAG TPA: hypothetical protein VN457_03075 [Chlamydiales bacterium]|nr:hypothetical protein [Chlamydiales bacterium]